MAHRLSHAKKNLFGPTLGVMRREAKITQAELSRRLQLTGWDVDDVVISYIEHGKRILSDIELSMILRALEAGLDDLHVALSQERKNFSPAKSALGKRDKARGSN